MPNAIRSLRDHNGLISKYNTKNITGYDNDRIDLIESITVD